ncbi:hypothetical protein N8D56_13785 [Devosia sp. A8/3-2]|nr:hypothetical protein N8D56_13785 [Devosia sp. A8/3-2]
MAQNSTPPNDPAASAFSAVEDALKDSVFNLDSTPEKAPEKRAANPARSERLRAADKIAQQAGAVANDDRFPTSKLLYTLQSRSSSAPTWVALALSVIWLVATGAAGYLRYGSQLSNFGQFASSIDFIALAAIMILPVLGFFGVATLFRRAQDLRNAASSITRAAILPGRARSHRRRQGRLGGPGRAPRSQCAGRWAGTRPLARRRTRSDDPQRGYRTRTHLFGQ